jgi:hypothetical protein
MDRTQLEALLLRASLALALFIAVLLAFPAGQRPSVTGPTVRPANVVAPNVLTIGPNEQQEPAGAATTVPAAPEIRLDLDAEPFFVSSLIGDDDNDGRTMDQPWRSLITALSRIQAGQTLYLMDGEYAETTERNFHYLSRNDGRPDAWIRITAAPGHNPVVKASTGTALEIQGNYTEVSNLRVIGEGFNEEVSFGVGLGVRRAHHVRFVDNVVSDMPLSGISTVESSNLEFIGNEVFDNSKWSSAQGSGISIWHSVDWDQPPLADGYHNRIIGNRIYRNENRVKSKWKNFSTITDGNGIIIDQNQHFNYTGRTLVANNVIFDNGGRGILVFESDRVDVMFNTTYRNGWTDGLEGGPVELAAGKANDVRFLNNLAWALPDAPGLRIGSSNNIEADGNILITTNQQTEVSDSNLVTGDDPGLRRPATDPETADFRPTSNGLVSAQPSFDARPALSFDADGNTRIAGAGTVGAYESPDAAG